MQGVTEGGWGGGLGYAVWGQIRGCVLEEEGEGYPSLDQGALEVLAKMIKKRPAVIRRAFSQLGMAVRQVLFKRYCHIDNRLIFF